MNKIVTTLLFVCLSISLFAQANKPVKFSGKVLNERNEPLAGVSVRTNTGSGAATGVDGFFTITLITGEKYQLTFSAIGYADKTISEVMATESGANELNIVMEAKVNALNNVVVTTRSGARKESINSLIAFQKNTNTVAQVVSAEAIRRTPDKNTGEILKRVPGTSIQEGKYIIIRGLSDRYNMVMLNGVPLSSTEPDRKTFSFDIFPSAMIDNIIINKAFVPEYPAEWAGGLVQINTKDIPSKGFLNVQVGTGFNSKTIGRDFYQYQGGKLDWLGVDDGTRGLPNGFPTKSAFSALKQNGGEQSIIDLGKTIGTNWAVNQTSAPLNSSFQMNGGFNTRLFGKEVGGILGVTYNRSIRNLAFTNGFYSFENNTPSLLFDYKNNKYSSDVLAGALANFSIKLDNFNKISIKNIINVNSSDFTTLRTGIDMEQDPELGENIQARELGFKSATFFNTQVTGEHNLVKLKTKIDWYGSFNILDGYVPQQRRIQYNQSNQTENAPYNLLIGASRSQKSGSVFYSMLSDYIYNTGGNVAKSFRLFNRPQTAKAGYLFQVKDRLFDSRPFSIYLPSDNPKLRQLDADHVFSAENFSATDKSLFHFDEISGQQYRYMANTILNATYLQFDNQLADWLRVVWGARYEHYDQLIGSTNTSDPRYTHNVVQDLLPALNATFKLDQRTNLRFSASQTLVRPEFRELTNFTFYDFELGAGVLGSSSLKRTKITNADLRYEIYPKAGELFTVGVFYKQFQNPIELYFNQSGVATNTFNYLNANKAKSYGAELEIRKKLDFSQALRNLTFQANVSYIYNRVEDSTIKINRPMQGQSPYLVNVALQYDVEKLGLNTTLLFNQIGRRILYVGNEVTPEIWEAPRPLLDLQIAKKVIKNKGEIKLNISDLINKTAYFYHDVDNSKNYKLNSVDALAISRNYGTNFSLSFTYNIK